MVLGEQCPASAGTHRKGHSPGTCPGRALSEAENYRQFVQLLKMIIWEGSIPGVGVHQPRHTEILKLLVMLDSAVLPLAIASEVIVTHSSLP